MRRGRRDDGSGARSRPALLALLVATVALGLLSRRVAGLPDLVRLYAGDALWAAMVLWLLALAAPRARTRTLAAGALAIAFAVEASQLWRTPWLDAVRDTQAGALALGQGFLWSDLACYAAGVALAAALDALLRTPARARALLAFLLLPGVVAFLAPWLLRPVGAPLRPIGLAPLALGVALLLWCVRDFHVAGRGTLAPWAPPERLVVVGLYRVTRNPMYVAVLLILAGWALAFASIALAAYAAVVAVAFHLRVVLGEEPWLARRHGAAWADYRARVPRWLLPVRRRDAGRARATLRG